MTSSKVTQGISPKIPVIVYAYIDGIEKFSYCQNNMIAGAKEFLLSRKGDVRENPVSLGQLYLGDVFYVTCIGTPDKLLPVYELMKNAFHCVYQKDIYSGEQWLEILPAEASKANAVMRLKEMQD